MIQSSVGPDLSAPRGVSADQRYGNEGGCGRDLRPFDYCKNNEKRMLEELSYYDNIVM